MRSDEELEGYVRDYTLPAYHPVGTCTMGIDDMAVVDPELRVRGVDGLRVVDASIMPIVPSSNTNAPSIMVGEKGSDLILGVETGLHAPSAGGLPGAPMLTASPLRPGGSLRAAPRNPPGP